MKSLLRQITCCYVRAQVSKQFFDKRDFSNFESKKIDNFFGKCRWLEIAEFWPKSNNSRESKILQSSSQSLVVYVTVCITESDRKVISLRYHEILDIVRIFMWNLFSRGSTRAGSSQIIYTTRRNKSIHRRSGQSRRANPAMSFHFSRQFRQSCLGR